ncbi:restriction endonuclease subunit S [Avibacterium volantium]|uniref:restriction endonuclease subunit S n=1 Tax=Avibacterium volantium TaxID=762 RepID=UPI003BF840F2
MNMKNTGKLSDVIEIIGGGTPKRSEPSYWNGNIPWLSVADFNNDLRFVSDTAEKITELGLKNSSTKLLKKGQIIISARGTVGCLAQLAKDMAFNQSCYGLNGKSGVIDNNFLYYFLKNNINELKQKTHGSVFDTITRATFDQIYISYPNILEQKKISDILGNLDQKIELNTQTNQTLEQIAQGIFKHWFIDFAPVHAKANALARGETTEQAELAAMACLSGKTVEKITALKTQDPTAYHQLQQTAAAFPSEFVETEMGEVPRGWEYRKAEDLFDIGIGKTPPRKESKWFSDYEKNNIEWISIKDMGNSGSYILNSSEYLIPEAISQFNIKKIPENTVLLSFKLTIGRISITTKETTTNEAIAHFKTGKSYLTTEFLYCYLKDFDFDKLGSTSSIATAVNSRTIKNMDILYPSEEIQIQFIQKVRNVFRKIKSNTLENEYLTKYRDELLPRLLSGEIEL